MSDIIVGIAAGIFVAVICMIFYRKGVRDGMGIKKGALPKVKRIFDKDEQGEAQTELLKKFETILNYDPYGEKI